MEKGEGASRKSIIIEDLDERLWKNFNICAVEIGIPMNRLLEEVLQDFMTQLILYYKNRPGLSYKECHEALRTIIKEVIEELVTAKG